MLAHALRRLLGAVPTLFPIVTAAFLLMQVARGGPFDRERPLEATVTENLERAFLLDRPFWERPLADPGNLGRGDLGPSLLCRAVRAQDLLGEALSVATQPGFTALALALVIRATLGSIAALRRNSRIDCAVISVATFAITPPNFAVAPALSLRFGVWLGVLPAGGRDGGGRALAILPVITRALPQVALIARPIRGAMTEARRSDHARPARAYGLPHRMIVVTPALRAAARPTVSSLGPAAALLTGSILVETMFGIPGVRRCFAQGALDGDDTRAMGTVVTVAMVAAPFGLFVDLACAARDPRARDD